MRKAIVEKACCSTYAMYSDSTNMYQTHPGKLFVFRYENGHSRVCFQMLSVQAREGRTLEICQNPSTITYTKVEVGTHHHRLRLRFT